MNAAETQSQTKIVTAEGDVEVEVLTCESDSVNSALEEELATVKDQLLRQVAEYQNFRRRTARERLGWTRRAQASVLEAMLSVLDDFSRSLGAAKEDAAPDAGFREGVQLVYDNLLSALAGFGVKPMVVEGKPFDEHLHEAILQVPASDDAGAGLVVQEVQCGYLHGEHVLRHAKVVVATQEEV